MSPLDPQSSGQRELAQQLLLVPTQIELNLVREFWPTLFQFSNQPDTNSKSIRNPSPVELCGFGLVVSGAQTARLIHRHSPQQVVLMGIAGGYCSPADVGTALVYSDVACYGIGVGTGSLFRSASQMGWKQWPNDDPRLTIGDSIGLICPRVGSAATTIGLRLLSVTSAAENSQDVALRRAYDPAAIAEEMEGFAVAVACQMDQVPLTIIRGISNLAGDRDQANWKIRDAMKAAVELAKLLILDN